MSYRKHIFNYRPEYSDMIYLGIFLLGIITIGLLPHTIFIFLGWLIIIAIFYFIINHKPSVFFFEDFIELRKGIFGTNTHYKLFYSDVQLIQYCFAEIRGAHLFKITFVKEGKTQTIQYSFRGRPSKTELALLERKKISVKVIPENAKHKLYGK